MKVPADPAKNPHARKIRDEPFYREWLLPRARFYNAQRYVKAREGEGGGG